MNQSVACANQDDSSSSSDGESDGFAHALGKTQSEQERLRSVLGAYLVAWHKALAWYYRVVSNVQVTTDNEQCLLKLSSVLALSDEQSDSLLVDCGLLRKNKNGLEFHRTNWEFFSAEYDIDIEFDQTKSKFFGTYKKLWVMRVGSYKPEQRRFNSKDQAKKVSRLGACLLQRFRLHYGCVESL